MNRIANVVGVWVSLTVITGIGTAQAAQTDMVRTFSQNQRILTLPTGVSQQQRSLIAVELSGAETGGNIFPGLLSALGPSQIDSTLYPQSDTSFLWSTDHWAGYSRTTYSYNAGNLSSNEIVDTFDGANWNHARQTLFTYTASLKVTSDTQKAWVSGVWTNQLLTTFTYDGSGNMTQAVLLGWGGSSWVNQNRVTYTITGGLLTSALIEKWVSSAWTNQSLHTNSYDGSSHLTQLLIQSWQSSAWTNQSLTTYAHNGSGDQTGSVTQLWQSSAWSNASKHTFAYNGSHQQTLDSAFSWSVSVWLGLSVDSTKYAGSLVSEEVFASLFAAGSTRIDYTHDSQGYKTSEVEQDWNLGTQQWDNSSRKVYVYGSGGTVSCCVGKRGNINGQGIIDLLDLSSLISYLTGGSYVLPCADAANVNGTGIIDLLDLSSLINYLTGGNFQLVNCP